MTGTVDRQITCIVRNGEPNDCTCITDVGTFDTIRLLSVAEVISLIEGCSDRFYVYDLQNTSRVYVVVAQKGERKYIRTMTDDSPDDSLLKLHPCYLEI